MMQKQIPLIVVAGPTASGKTRLAIDLARRYGGEVVSADSMQIYQGMAIGTAQPTREEMGEIPHHLVGFLPPGERFSVADYVELARKTIADIHRRDRLPILAGGTGLYISSLIDNVEFAETGSSLEIRERYRRLAEREGNAHVLECLRRVDPETAEKLHPNNIGRVIRALELYELTGIPMSRHKELSRRSPSPYRLFCLGLDYRERQTLYDRINLRVEKMVEAGLLEEAEQLFRSPYSATAAQAIGYKELLPYFQGDQPLDSCLELIRMQSRRYAKRQLTWFRRDERMHWYFPDDWESYAGMFENITRDIEKSGILCYTE
ncbi:MAG: tRNA (adenosine(37)-N6)-dimethylallyltransferase MiaA [Clostridiales bacterium]|nr:tRNA (adenosine(37)-N6)-dimethylallyltransferase MiaA [Clostridiales bacterium]